MDELPPAAPAAALAFAAASDAVTDDAVKSPKLLDADVGRPAGIGIFTTAHKLDRFEPFMRRKPARAAPG